MGRVYEGSAHADGKRFAIVASRFNNFLVDKLVEGACEAFIRAGASDEDVDVFRCPGAFEIPALLKYVVNLERYHGIACLGLALRGTSAHFDRIVNEATRGVARVAVECKVGIGFAVLACDTIEQAIERSGGKSGNRGADAALVAIEMASVYANDLVGSQPGHSPMKALVTSSNGPIPTLEGRRRLTAAAVVKTTAPRRGTNGKARSGTTRASRS